MCLHVERVPKCLTEFVLFTFLWLLSRGGLEDLAKILKRPFNLWSVCANLINHCRFVGRKLRLYSRTDMKIDYTLQSFDCEHNH